MPFKAETAVAPLDYDFRPFVDCHGTTPEPSDKAIRRFQMDMTSATKSAMAGKDVDITNAEKVVAFILNMEEEDYEKVNELMIEATAKITAGMPSQEQIAALPGRIQRAYMLSLQHDLVNPEPGSVATKS